MTMEHQRPTSTSLREQRQEETKSKHAVNESPCNGFLSCIDTAPMFDKTMNYCNALSAGFSDFKKKRAKEKSSFGYHHRQSSIPSEVFLADLSKTNASADGSICKCVSKTTTFQTTDTTLYNSSYEQGTKDFEESSDILFQNSEHINLNSSSRRNRAQHQDLVLQFSEVSSISCPSFSDQSADSSRVYSEDKQLGDIHLMQDFEEMSIGVGMGTDSIADSDGKDSLLSFENSSISGGSDAVLDMLSLDSEEYGEEGDGHTRLSNLCEQSVQSSTRSDGDQFDDSLNYTLRLARSRNFTLPKSSIGSIVT